ncbi:ABC transporter ATP-binding protein [uncultured Secundilactobacillus sp.]|uniref:ABC transporter ATP-binding protein n=1 Tax=uncultured Secundilactobacillus sp. TaxID=2813935 RepID=UPI00258C7DD8|nr:ABC transporter ATP-binding protein [uncultured Secundilactobacillus sp.]
MITFQHLSKHYGDKVALADLSLTIPSGEIFGFLGHNGAGKSTTLKSLVSVIAPTSGTISVDDLDLAGNRLAVKRKIGYVPDSPDLFLELTAGDYWDLLASAYEVDPTARAHRQDELVRLFNMQDSISTPMADFSHGMRQKAIIIGALLPDPDVWILDEPMTGLDPQAAYDLKRLMRHHADEGKTVVFSTHVLATAQELCDELAILKSGKLIYNGRVDQLLATMPDENLESIYLKLAGRPENDEVWRELEGADQHE